MMDSYDVVIVGARCAGSSLANFLARKGYSILLIDRSSFPSDTLSTHVFGDWEMYQKLEVDQEIKGSGAPEITRFRVDINGCTMEGPLLVTPSVSGLRRVKLDQILLNSALKFPNVCWRPQCKAIELIWENDQVTGLVIEESGTKTRIKSRVVIGADGRNSTIARLTQAAERFGVAPTRCAYYGYFQNVVPTPIPTFEFYWSDQELVLVNPCDDDLHCIVVMPLQSEFQKWKSSSERLLVEKLNQVPTLAPRLKHAKLLSKVFGSGTLRSFIRQSYGSGWALIGDASGAVHPCSGIGIDQAIRSADLLAECVHPFFSDEKNWDDAMTIFKERRETILRQTINSSVSLETLILPDQESLTFLNLLFTMPNYAHKLAKSASQLSMTLLGEEKAKQVREMLKQLYISK